MNKNNEWARFGTEEGIAIIRIRDIQTISPYSSNSIYNHIVNPIPGLNLNRIFTTKLDVEYFFSKISEAV